MRLLSPKSPMPAARLISPITRREPGRGEAPFAQTETARPAKRRPMKRTVRHLRDPGQREVTCALRQRFKVRARPAGSERQLRRQHRRQASRLSAGNPSRREAAFVLVVGDDAIMRRCLVRVVRRLGYWAREAGSPLAAQRAAIESRRIDLLLTDLSMPETNGPKLARWFRIASPETRVLITTGSLWELQCDAGELDQFALLAKPFTTAELAHMVRLLLRQADSASHRQARKSDHRTRRVE